MNRLNRRRESNMPSTIDAIYVRDNTISLELKGFIVCISYLADRGLDLTYDSLSDISGLSYDETVILVKKCVELGIIECI